MYQLKIIFYGLLCQNIAYFVTAEGQCAQQTTPNPQSVALKDNLLFCGYDKAVSQMHQNNKVTNINITMMIKSISVDDHFNTIYVRTWNVLEWIDERLSWQISEYSGVNVLHLDTEEIWIPPLNVFIPHSFWGVGDPHPSGRCNVLPNGKMVCVTSNIYTHHCAPDFTYWPQDTVNCRIFIFSVGQDVVFHLKEGEVNTAHYNENYEWGLLSAMIHINGSTEYNYTYQWITLDLSLQRHNNMHRVSMIFPALVLSFLVLVTFWLDANEEYRIKLLCVATVCNCLQLFCIEDQVGNTGNTLPLLVKFYRDSLIMSGISFLITVAIQILLKLQYAPNWLPVTRLFIMKYQLANILLISQEVTKEDTVSKENGREEDGLLKPPPIDASLEWNVFVKLLDRALFLLFLFLHLFTILKFLLVDVTNPTFEHKLIY